MAVYTQVSQEQVEQLLADFDFGAPLALKGIDGGIENTNYFVTTSHLDKNEFVLTLFEELGRDEVPFFVELGNWLANRSVPVSYAIPDRNGIALKQVAGKPAILQPRYSGAHVSRADLKQTHCEQIGAMLAHYHLAGEDFYLKRQAHRGVFWWRRESGRLANRLPADDRQLLTEEVHAFDQFRESDPALPMGIIHGDLFHDNALFDHDQLTAVLDIYNAATAYWLFDLAIVVNDWCVRQDLSIDTDLEHALLKSYASVRPFQAAEHEAWPLLVRTAAMRFWLSRLVPWIEAEDGKKGKTLKAPDEYRTILLNRRAEPASLPA